MEQYLIKIADLIKNTALEEDKFLKEFCGKGIFWMPELAFAYEVGKKLLLKKKEIFPNTTVEWIRETTIEGYGRNIFDLRINIEDSKPLLISFKMNSDQNNFVKDIEILNAIDPIRYEKIFCSFKLCNESEKEEYHVEKSINSSSKMIEQRLINESFETWWPNIIWKSFCQFGVWKIK